MHTGERSAGETKNHMIPHQLKTYTDLSQLWHDQCKYGHIGFINTRLYQYDDK